MYVHCQCNGKINKRKASNTGARSDTWRLQSNYLVTRTMMDGTMVVFSTGEYQDKIVLSDGVYRFNERIVICDHGMINNLIALPL